MGMHPQLGSFTEKNSRSLFFKKELGCEACFIRFGAAGPGGQGHHAENDEDVVIGHHAIIVLCDWHHNGNTPGGFNSRSALSYYGPSRHKHRVAFREEFGTDLQLLERSNARLEAYLDTFIIRPAI